MRKMLVLAFLAIGALVVAGCGGKSSKDGDQQACGNGVLDDGEQCDYGLTTAGEGCSTDCKVMPGWTCPTNGLPTSTTPCVATKCGDSILAGDEQCDYGLTTAGEGCSTDCKVMPGWTCPSNGLPTPTTPCVATQCGDGIVAGTEQCDLGAANGTGTGCTAGCQIEDGWGCDATHCWSSPCGNGDITGTNKQCDNGTGMPFNGCSAECKNEPDCTAGLCKATCGDGIVMTPEECDDGNTTSGDGCSADCKIETGFTCTLVEDPNGPPATVYADVIYRDFLSINDDVPNSGGAPYQHPDFEAFNCSSETQNLVNKTLNATTLKPDFSTDTNGKTTIAGCDKTQITSTTTFASWYADDPNYNKTAVSQIPLTLVPNSSPLTYSYDSKAGFFPFDTLAGWGKTTRCNNLSPGCPSGDTYWPDDFGFTSEIRYWFTYEGGETLTFTGDDDVWVFINNQLVVDLGGLHPKRSATLTLSTDPGTQKGIATTTYSSPTTSPQKNSTLGLEPGGVYEMAFFHAERHTTESNFMLSLGNFVKAKSVCKSDCGDGIVAADEQCDLGTTDRSPATCTPPNCNGVSGSGCTKDCKFEGGGHMGG